MFGINFWTSTSVEEQAKNDARTKILKTHTDSDLTYDPLYLICTIATIAISQNKFLATTPNPTREQLVASNNYKITFNQNGTININAPSFYQGFSRSYQGASYTDLSIIFPHLTKLLKCHEFESKAMRTILKKFKESIKIIKMGYLNDDGSIVTVTQRDGDAQKTVDVRLCYPSSNEKKLITETLESIKKLVKKALKFPKMTDVQKTKFRSKINELNKKYFPTYSITNLEREADNNRIYTIDDLFQKLFKKTWDAPRLTGIASFMSTPIESSSTNDETILSQISNVPSAFANNQEKILTFLTAALEAETTELKTNEKE